MTDRRFTIELTEQEVCALLKHHQSMVRRVTNACGKACLDVRKVLARSPRETKILIDEAQRLSDFHLSRGKQLIALLKG